MEISLVEKIKIFAKGKQVWINGGEFERLALNEGYKASNAGRRCRELVKAGIFERRENEKGNVEYKYKSLVPIPAEYTDGQRKLI